MYYLDTSTLRALGGKLSSIPAESCKTSALALVEMLNGMRASEQDYRRRSSPIRAVMSLGMQVVWEMVYKRVARGFDDLVYPDDAAIQALRGIVGAVQVAPSLELFMAALPNEEDLQHFEQFDLNFAVGVAGSIGAANQDMKRHFLKEKHDGSGILDPSLYNGSFAQFNKRFHAEHGTLNTELTKLALARTLASETGEAESSMFKRYNGKLDTFIAALTHRSITYAVNMSGPARNDLHDDSHMLYIEPGDTMITEDAGLAKLCDAVGVPVESHTALLP